MNQGKRQRKILPGVFLFAIGYGLFLVSATSAQTAPITKEQGRMTLMRASGTFDVKLTPRDDQVNEKPTGQPADSKGSTALGRMTIDKKFHGDLEGISQGQMLSAMTSVQGSAGYVAIEKVTGTLQGKSGSFVLQHSGTMTRGAPELTVTVVPDSATGQLIGLAGKMTIKITDGKHFYDFEYTLGKTP